MRRLASFALLAMLAGCAAFKPQEVANPQAITVRQAFLGVADGLKAFQASVKPLYLGMITCKIDIKFTISALASQGGKYGGEIGAPAAYIDAKITGEQDNASSASRGNTVEVILGSVDPATCGAVDGGGGAKDTTDKGSDEKPKKPGTAPATHAAASGTAQPPGKYPPVFPFIYPKPGTYEYIDPSLKESMRIQQAPQSPDNK